MFDTTRKKVIATRIKELRTSRKLSHQKLADELKNNYDIAISVDSLKQYEIDNEYHAKWDKVQGMNIKYLYCLADFFDVSADYLLGNTDVKSPNTKTRAICDYTGLSEEVVDTLHSWNKDKEDWYVYENYLNFLNTLLFSKSFYCALVDDYERYLSSFEFCKLLELENTDIDFSNTTPTLLIFNEENEENKKKRIRQEEINKIKEEYSKEIKDIQPINLFKIQKRFISFIENYATAEKDSITSIDEIIQKWNKKKEYDEKWSGIFESIKNTLKEYKEKRKDGEE